MVSAPAAQENGAMTGAIRSRRCTRGGLSLGAGSATTRDMGFDEYRRHRDSELERMRAELRELEERERPEREAYRRQRDSELERMRAELREREERERPEREVYRRHLDEEIERGHRELAGREERERPEHEA